MRESRALATIALTTAFVGAMITPASADVVSPYGVTLHSAPECIFENNTVILRVTPQTDEATSPGIILGVTNPAYSPEPVWTPPLPGVNTLNYREYEFARMGLPWDNTGALIGNNVTLTVYYAWGMADGTLWEVSETLPDYCYL